VRGSHDPALDAEHLRSLKELERINNKPVARLGKKVNRQDEVEKSRTGLAGRKAAQLHFQPIISGISLSLRDRP
jgi:hypothetical protein